MINCPTAIASGVDAARAVIDTVARKRRCVLTNWLGSGSASEARRLFAAARIPTFETPDDAVTGFMHVVRYRRGQDIIMEVPVVDADGIHSRRRRGALDRRNSAGPRARVAFTDRCARPLAVLRHSHCRV